MGVASPRIFAAVRAGGLATVAEVTEAVRAGGGCGLCHPELEEILREARGEAVDAVLARENAAVCHQETTARVAMALLRILTPIGVSATAVEVDGLSVRVRLRAAPDPALATHVAERLRRNVCAELDVEIACEGSAAEAAGVG
jgi:NifU-like protein